MFKSVRFSISLSLLFVLFTGCSSEKPPPGEAAVAEGDSLVYDTSPRWMGESIHFYSYRHDPEGAELYSVSMSDGSLTRLTDTYHNEWWSEPSPEGHLTYISTDFEKEERFDGSDIFELNLETGNTRRITENSGAGVFNILPRLSPDGTRLLFSGDFIGPKVNAEIYAVKLDGTDLVNLTESPAVDRSAAWSPDGSRVVFSSDRSGNFELYTMAPDGSELVQLTDSPWNETQPDWETNGDRIVFTSDETGIHQLSLLDIQTRHISRLTTSSKKDVLASWSPDGEWIAFASYRNGDGDKGDIYIIRPDGTDEKRMTPR